MVAIVFASRKTDEPGLNAKIRAHCVHLQYIAAYSIFHSRFSTIAQSSNS